MEKKTQQTLYLDVAHKEKLEEIAIFRKRLGDKTSYGDIVSEGIDILHDMVAADYFQKYTEEYPRWKNHWKK